jgi:hypothetical protein
MARLSDRYVLSDDYPNGTVLFDDYTQEELKLSLDATVEDGLGKVLNDIVNSLKTGGTFRGVTLDQQELVGLAFWQGYFYAQN